MLHIVSSEQTSRLPACKYFRSLNSVPCDTDVLVRQRVYYPWMVCIWRCAAVRAAELRMLERVNIALSLAFVSPGLVVSAAAMITLLAYTSYGNNLSPQQVSDIFRLTSKCYLVNICEKVAKLQT